MRRLALFSILDVGNESMESVTHPLLLVTTVIKFLNLDCRKVLVLHHGSAHNAELQLGYNGPKRIWPPFIGKKFRTCFRVETYFL